MEMSRHFLGSNRYREHLSYAFDVPFIEVRTGIRTKFAVTHDFLQMNTANVFSDVTDGNILITYTTPSGLVWKILVNSEAVIHQFLNFLPFEQGSKMFILKRLSMLVLEMTS